MQTNQQLPPRQHLNLAPPELLHSIVQEVEPPDVLSMRWTSNRLRHGMRPEVQQVALMLTRIDNMPFSEVRDILGNRPMPTHLDTPPEANALVPVPFAQLSAEHRRKVFDAVLRRFDQEHGYQGTVAHLADAIAAMQPQDRIAAMRRTIPHLLAPPGFHGSAQPFLERFVARLTGLLHQERGAPLREAAALLTQGRYPADATLIAFQPLLAEDDVGHGQLERLTTSDESETPALVIDLLRSTMRRQEPQRTVALQLMLQTLASREMPDRLRIDAFDHVLQAIENGRSNGQLDGDSVASLRQSLQLAIARLPARFSEAWQGRIDNLS